MIVSEKVLTDYDPSLPLRLACDASPVDIEAAPVPRDEGRYRATYSLCFKDIHQNAAKLFTD